MKCLTMILIIFLTACITEENIFDYEIKNCKAKTLYVQKTGEFYEIYCAPEKLHLLEYKNRKPTPSNESCDPINNPSDCRAS